MIYEVLSVTTSADYQKLVGSFWLIRPI